MHRKARLLAVDDNARNIAIMQRCLGREFVLTSARSGEEALEIAPRLRPDAVLLDIMMPGIDGYETCRRLRACGDLAGIKIIMVSAKAMTSERLEGYAAGADDYLVKPFDQDELLAKVRVYVKLKSVEEVDRLKSEVLSLLSHETGTPLTGVIGGLSLLRDTAGLTEEQLEFLDMAETSADRLHGLVQRVCMISELRARSSDLPRHPFDLRELAAQALGAVRDKARAARIHLVFEPGLPAPTSGDAGLIRWAVDALLENAIHVSPPEGKVVLGVDLDGACTGLSVADQGPGIGPALMPRIFQEFVVADIAHHHGGSGLSLAAAHLIVERHGGELTVRTEAGQGSVFRIHLPASQDLSAAA